ncbi:MAG: septum formation initiator family protein [Acidobacteria bacterium]|nr:septum formation initiator family protein [Acidobacteriota bacterium]
MNRVANTSLVNDVKSNVSLTYEQIISLLQMPTYVWVAMVMLAATGLCYSLTVHTRNELNNAQLQYNQVDQEVKQLESENAKIVRRLNAIEKDPRTVETLAREAGMIASGETVIFLPSQQNKSQVTVLKK